MLDTLLYDMAAKISGPQRDSCQDLSSENGQTRVTQVSLGQAATADRCSTEQDQPELP